MKKLISLLASSMLVLSFSLATAATVGVSVSSGGSAISVGSACMINGRYGTYASNGQCVISAYTTGNYSRNTGTQSVDLSFVNSLVGQTGSIVAMLPKILLGVAVVVFFFFLIKYLIAGNNNPEERGKQMKGMMFSLLAIFIMVALWGIVAFFGDAIGINPNVQVNAPALPQ